MATSLFDLFARGSQQKTFAYIAQIAECEGVGNHCCLDLVIISDFLNQLLILKNHFYLVDDVFLTLSLPNVAKGIFGPNFQMSFSKILTKKIAPCESTGRELSFEWSHHRISSADSKVRVALQNSVKYSGSEGVN